MEKSQFMNKIKFYFFIFLFTCFFSSVLYAEKNYVAEGEGFFLKKNLAKSKFKFEKDIVFNPKSEKSYLYLAKIFNNSLDTVDTSRSTDDPNLGKYNILESDVKAYYKRNNLPYDRKLFLGDSDIQTTVATNLVSRVSLEAHSLGGEPGKKMNGPMLRQLFNRLLTGKFERTYENLPGPFKGSILDPVHTKGTLFLNNYRLYGVNQ